MNIPALLKGSIDVIALENALKAEEQVECKLQHHFSPGIYVRTIEIPKGTFVIGKRHRHQTCNILLKGALAIYMTDGQEVTHLKAPCVFNSEPGVKKVVYAEEDVLFSNIHNTNETDLDKIEQIFIISEEEYLEQQEVIEWVGER